MTATEKTTAPRVVTTTRATACPKCAQPPTTSSLVHAAPGQVLHRCEPCGERWATEELVRPTDEDRLSNIEEALSGLLHQVGHLSERQDLRAVVLKLAKRFDERRPRG